jgi:MFS transporter, FSR family, fosmidomycin resistance protein
METTLGRLRGLEVVRNRPLITLMMGHLTVDMYSGLLPLLYPLLIQHYSLDLKSVGLVALAYSGSSSLSQPLFGWMADRYGTRLIGLALIWSATFFAIAGFVGTFPMLLLMVGAAGLGSGAYHPLGALNASAVIPAHQRNLAMSVYVTGGTVGFSMGPLVGAVLFTVFGLRGTALMFLPGVTIALWLLWQMRGSQGMAVQRRAQPETRQRESVQARFNDRRTRAAAVPMIAVLGVMMMRMWTLSSLGAFIPVWYQSMGYSAAFYGPLATTVLISGAAGALVAGTLADRFGRRNVIVWSLVLTIPALLWFVHYPGPMGFVSGALIGLSAASTSPLMLVMAQQLMSGRAGMASGIILGLGFVTGAIGVPITGAIADVWGIPFALQLQVLMVLATFLLARYLPTESQIEKIQATTR